MHRNFRRIGHGLGMAVMVLTAVLLLRNPDITSKAVQNGLQICVASILPALFPFAVLTNLWTGLGYGERLHQFAAPVMERIFRLPGAAASAWVLGAIGGYPIGAQTALQLYQSGQLTKKDAEQTLAFCNNCGPAFIISVVGYGLFHSTKTGVVLFLIHIGSSFLLGFFFRPQSCISLPQCPGRRTSAQSPLSLLTAAVQSACISTLRISAFILFFSIVSDYWSALAPAALQQNKWWPLVLGSLELGGGTHKLLGSSLSQQELLICASFLLGWGGICVHMQTAALLNGSGLSLRRYFTGKLCHGLLSAGITWSISPFFQESPASQFQQAVTRAYPVLQLLLLLVTAAWILLLVKITTGKHSANRI